MATRSDWMAIEKQRGISVATSVMGFDYKGLKINILDTPGHEDFAEDTYRTLTAVDSVIMVIDCVKGVEKQTRKLMEVCRMRKTPVLCFINKLDREGRDPFDLIDEIEEELKINVQPLTWPIGMGKTLRGVYNLFEKNINLFEPRKNKRVDNVVNIKDVNDPDLETYLPPSALSQLREDIELIKSLRSDVILGIGIWRSMLPSEFINIPKYGYIGLHGTALPEYRGFAGINWQIINGASEIKMHALRLGDGIDDGNLVCGKDKRALSYSIDIKNEKHLDEVFFEYEKKQINPSLLLALYT